jgi:hypothetical protein
MSRIKLTEIKKAIEKKGFNVIFINGSGWMASKKGKRLIAGTLPALLEKL